MLRLVQILVKRIWRVDRVKLLCRISALLCGLLVKVLEGYRNCALAYSVFEDDLHASWMFWKEFRHIIRLAMHYYPAGLLGAMLSNLGASQSHLEYADVGNLQETITRSKTRVQLRKQVTMLLLTEMTVSSPRLERKGDQSENLDVSEVRSREAMPDDPEMASDTDRIGIPVPRQSARLCMYLSL